MQYYRAEGLHLIAGWHSKFKNAHELLNRLQRNLISPSEMARGMLALTLMRACKSIYDLATDQKILAAAADVRSGNVITAHAELPENTTRHKGTNDGQLRPSLARNGRQARMDLNEVARIFNDSYERVMNATGNPEAFFTEFYKLLIATSPEAAVKFRDTDMKQQVRMLRGSVALLLSFYATGDQDGYLSKLAERHSKQGKDIPPQMYSVWLDCLIETARQIDPGFNEDVSAAWRAVFSKGIAFMVAKYEKRDDMTSPQSQLEQLDKLVRDMLVIPRSENGECVVQKVPCMLDRLVPEAVQSASIFARTKWIRIETGEMPESPIEADPNLIRQMLLIVLYNAVEYSPCGSTVAVMLNFNSDYYEVLVLDEGGTIIRSEREWVFRDDQTDARRSHESGSYRLGLPTAKSIANVHGGFLDLVGSDTEGSTFRIRLPKPSVDLKH